MTNGQTAGWAGCSATSPSTARPHNTLGLLFHVFYAKPKQKQRLSPQHLFVFCLELPLQHNFSFPFVEALWNLDISKFKCKTKQMGRSWDIYLTFLVSPPSPSPLSMFVSQLELLTINRHSCTITEKAPTSAFSWLKAATTAFTFKTLLRHYAKQTGVDPTVRRCEVGLPTQKS